MSKELVISSNRHETKVAVLEDDQLVEVFFQRSDEYSLAGSIHKGRVTRVLPGMQSAFVDLGLERDTFLYVSDFLEEHEDFDKVTGDERPVRSERSRDDRPRGDRGRGDRDRSRDDRPRGPQPQAQSPVSSVADGSAVAQGVEGASTESSPTPVAAGARAPGADAGGPASGQDQRNRRGRRRRRRGSRGFPESKYAADGAPQSAGSAPPPVEEAEVEGESELETEVHAEESTAPVGESASIVLPGESLRKYRGHVTDAAEAAAVTEDLVDNEYDEPIHYPPENALPDAPVHEQPPMEAVAAEIPAAPATESKADIISTPPPVSKVVASHIHATSALRAETSQEATTTSAEHAPQSTATKPRSKLPATRSTKSPKTKSTMSRPSRPCSTRMRIAISRQ